jgi:membrane fusion protein (multidrug efflux system)
MQLIAPTSPKHLAPGRVLGAVLLAALSLTACSRPTQAPPPPAPIEVATVTVTRQPIVLTTELPGRTSPYRIAEIRPQINGLIKDRLFEEGSEVKEGQVLFQIDPAPFQAALDNAQAALGRSEANLPATQARVDRFKQALADKAVSQQDYEDADAALKQAQADVAYWKAMLQTARINLGYARVVSPIAGRIGKSSVTVGAIVTAYQPTPLATIQQMNPIYVDVPQSTTELLRLRHRLENRQLMHDGTNGNRVQLVLGDGTPYPLEGTLQFTDVSVDPTTASVILRMVFPNTNDVLLPSMFVRAIVKEGVNPEAILVPQQSVSRDPKGNPLVLLVAADSKVEQRMIGLDRALGDQWLVSSNLVAGDRVIVEGMQKVRPGATVKAVPFPGSAHDVAGSATPARTVSAAK